MGVVINTPGSLNNFEIAFSGDVPVHEFPINLEFRLLIIRSINNIGTDYVVPTGTTIFLENITIDATDNGQISGNTLSTTLNPPNCFPGDRLVIFFLMISFEELEFVTGVGASIEFTPSTI